jgi:signal transduction histidine kinase
MNVLRPTRDVALIALVCGLWAVLALADEGLALAAGLGSAAALVASLHRRLPLMAMLGAVVVSHLGVLLGLGPENPWDLAMFLAGAYGLGRYGTRLGGVVAVSVLVPFWAFTGEVAVGSVLFGLVVLGGAWTLGALVRRQEAAAGDAAAEAGSLAAQDPAVRAAQAVAEERARLAGDALAVVRGAVIAMQRHAVGAVGTLDPAAIGAIQEEGRRATQDLRRLLGLLRSETPVLEEPQRVPPRAGSRWRTWIAPAVVGLLLTAEGAAELHFTGRLNPLAVVLAVALAATVLLRRSRPAFACVLATVPPAVALVTGTALFYDVWIGIVCLLLAWSVSTAPTARPRHHLALVIFLGILFLDIRVHDPGNEAMTLVFGLVPAISGHLWACHRRAREAAVAVAAGLRAEHDDVAARAVRTERLRLARELHDVTSHSVGVMVLQAGAATVLRESEPEDARAALRNVEVAGEEALRELEVLFGLLDAGAIGSPGHAAAAIPQELGPALEDMAERMRHAGLGVTLTLDPSLRPDPALSSTSYRVVQEALTNAARYAPGAGVEVILSDRTAALEVVVRDDGSRSGRSTTGSGTGFGLVGLDERIRDLGGELRAGPREGGGFEVRARLPVGPRVEVGR